MDSVYKGSFLQFDITPNVSKTNPAFLQGMAGGLRQSNAVAIPLSIEMCMLEDSNFTKLLFVTADILGFDKMVVDEVRRHAVLWGIEPDGIVLNASHTHYAPGTVSNMPDAMGPFYENYSGQILKLIVTNLRKLYDSLEPCELSCGKAEAQIGVNRRYVKGDDVYFAPNPEGAYVKDTPLLKIVLKSSGKEIIWVSHGCHPTGMGVDTRISSDYSGFMKNELRRNSIADGVMFFQGAGGSSKQALKKNGHWKFCDNINDVSQNGFKLAGIVKESVSAGLVQIKGQFYSKLRSITLPLSETGETDKINKSSPALPTEVQLVCIGDNFRMLTFPMELVAELAQKIQACRGVTTQDFLLGYTNGLDGYLTDDSMIEAGGYEVEKSHLVYQKPAPLAIGTERTVLDSIRTLLDGQDNVASDNGYGRYHRTQKPKKAFFVLSSGRCGTMTLAHLLDTASNARVWHHPQPDPIQEALLAWWGKIDRQKTFWRSRRSVITKSWAQGLIHGETDLLMTPFCDTIAEEIPGSKFIILVREPKNFVRSGMRRDYYQGHPWDIGRLRPENGSRDFERWNTLDQLEKVSWLWNETYARILKMMKGVSENRIKTVKFEDLISDVSTTEMLFEFLELEGFEKKKIENLLTKKLNAQKSGTFPDPENWDAKMRRKSKNQFGDLQRYFKYETIENKKVSDESIPVKADTASRKPKLLFLEQLYQSTGGHLDHVVNALNNKYDVKYLKTLNTTDARSAVSWADIVWLEWANQMAIHATNDIPEIRNKKVICRLHGYEVFTSMPAKINWDNVHHLIFVAKHKKDIFDKKFGNKNVIKSVIRNGVNLEKFSISRRKKNTKKLVLLGHLNFRKGLPILLHFFQQLLKQDPAYYLYIRGEFQDPKLELAAKKMIQELELSEKLEFVDWVNDLNGWLADKSHILSFSLEESFHYAIGNGMAAGLKPVIHAWTESRDIWPNEFIFKNLDEFLTIVSDEMVEPDRYRQLIVDNHLTATSQLNEIEKILQSLDESKKSAINGAIDVNHDLKNAHSNQDARENRPKKIERSTRCINTKTTKHKEVFKSIEENQFNNRNELQLWLRDGESIEPYMDMNYSLIKNGQSFDDNVLIYSLQNALHRMCTSYFNYNLISPDDRKLVARLGKLLNDRKICRTIDASQNNERLLSFVFQILREINHRSKNKIEIKIQSLEKKKNLFTKHPKVTSIYNAFREIFVNLFEQGFISLFIVHGSMSTLDYTLFSDVDTQLFFTDKVFESENTIQQTMRVISDANRYIKLFDPLQHHGYFISTDMDRMNYPQSYLPYETMEQATRIFGSATQAFYDRSCVHEIRTAIWNLSYFFRKTFLENYRPNNPFDMKRYLSRFSMLPVLYLELFENMFPYKKESFVFAKPFFSDVYWQVFDTVSEARKKWVPSSLMLFNKHFYYQVWMFAEIMLSRLKEHTNE